MSRKTNGEFDVRMASADRFLISAEMHMRNYRAVVAFDPTDAGFEYLFAREDLRVAKLHLAAAERALKGRR